MIEFTYLAVTKEGKEKRGNIAAQDRGQALKKVKTAGLIPIEVRRTNLLNREINLDLTRKVKLRDLSIFCRQFVSMLSAGVTIIDSLGMLSEQTENKRMAKAIKEVQADIEKGQTMAEAMGAQEKVFPDMMVSMIAAGEASGNLDTAFRRMAEHFEKEAKLKGLIRKASVYPIMVGIVALVIVGVMLVVIIPRYGAMFEDLDVELPLATLWVLHISQFMAEYWYFIVAGLATTVVAVYVFAKSTPGMIFFGKMARKIPLFGKLNVKTAASRFARTLSTLIYSGLSMVDALELVAHTMTNALYDKALMDARENVMKGVPLSEPIKKSNLFPPMVTHMITIGEETGDLEEMLTKLADYYDEEVEMTTQTVMAALEPMIIIILSGIVGLLVLTTMAPMVKMYSSMDNL